MAAEQSASEQVLANLLELLIGDPQGLVNVVLECAVNPVHLIESGLKKLSAIKQLRLEVDGFSQAAGTHQRIELRVACCAAELIGEQVILDQFFLGHAKSQPNHGGGPAGARGPVRVSPH